LPAFSLVRTSRKDTLKEFETAIKMAPPIKEKLYEGFKEDIEHSKK